MGDAGEWLGEGPVGIVGLGLMGGSVARALKELEGAPSILASSLEEDELKAARAEGVVDEAFLEPGPVVVGASTVILAAPLGAVGGLLREHASALAERRLVMDLAGLKAPVLRRAEGAGLATNFVGSHPMAGSEASGFRGSRSDLFRGAVVWLAEVGAGESARRSAEAFWTGLDTDPRWIEADRHDAMMAWCSHLPQLLSNALAGALDSAGYEPEDLGPGGRDMVRLAGSSPEVWRDLLERSAPQVGVGLESVTRALRVLADLLARRDMDAVAAFMDRTRRWRGDDPWT